MSASDLVRPSERFKQLLADPDLRERFLPGMAPEELDAVERLLEPVADQVRLWCAQYAVLDPKPVPALTVLMAVQFPNGTVAETVLRVKTILWIFAIDDFLDDPTTEPGRAAWVAADCTKVAMLPTGTEKPQSVYGAVLRECKDALPQFPLYLALAPLWSVALVKLIDAMMHEYWWSHRVEKPRAAPSIEEYLYFGKHSIGLPFVWFSSAIIANDPHLLANLDELWELSNECGVSMRVANDLDSFEAELAEGKIGSLQISGGTGGKNSLDSVSQLLASSQSRANQRAEAIDGAGSLARQFVRSTQFGVQIYKLGDYKKMDRWFFPRDDV